MALDGAQPYRGSARPWSPDPAVLRVAVETASPNGGDPALTRVRRRDGAHRQHHGGTV